MKTFLIIYDDTANLDLIKDRIKSLGTYYNFLGNHWLVKTEIESPKEIHNTIVRDDMKTTNIVIFNIDTSSGGYWGFMNNALWQWLKK